MTSNEVEIVLVEDNPNDAELALRALKAHHLANNLIWLQDGVEAIDFIFAQGQYSDRSLDGKPKVILLDLKLPKVDGLQVFRESQVRYKDKECPCCRINIFFRGARHHYEVQSWRQ